MIVFFLMRDTPQTCGLPPVEEYKNDYPPHYAADSERTFTFREIFVEHVLTNRYLWAIAVANAFVYFVRYGVVNWIPTYLQTAKGFSFSSPASAGRCTNTRRSRARSPAAGCRTRCSRAGARRRRSCSWR